MPDSPLQKASNFHTGVVVRSAMFLGTVVAFDLCALIAVLGFLPRPVWLHNLAFYISSGVIQLIALPALAFIAVWQDKQRSIDDAEREKQRQEDHAHLTALFAEMHKSHYKTHSMLEKLNAGKNSSPRT